MKKIFTFSVLAVAIAMVFGSCTKRGYYEKDDIERATVIDYVNGTPYSLIQYDYDRTYAVVESMEYDTQYWPEVYDRLEGRFYEGQQRRIYNITAGFYINLYVVENVPTKADAFDALDYYAHKYLTTKANNKTISQSDKRRIQ
ncbi:MAG TPA: hypothetical protein PK110_03585 [Niabella sp.]|jgi:hypothetical protein|nr:hypothetical protein [Chitinophagaceae bacterium]HRN49175.1 hypothetical protein [Niabella sp.]HRO83883.1 hypothetical protein [Niabella sp.]